MKKLQTSFLIWLILTVTVTHVADANGLLEKEAVTQLVDNTTDTVTDTVSKVLDTESEKPDQPKPQNDRPSPVSDITFVESPLIESKAPSNLIESKAPSNLVESKIPSNPIESKHSSTIESKATSSIAPSSPNIPLDVRHIADRDMRRMDTAMRQNTNIPSNTGVSSQASPGLGRNAFENSSSMSPGAQGLSRAKNMWGIQPESVDTKPRGSMHFVFVGKVLSIDRYKNKVVLKGPHKKMKTVFVDSKALPFLRKGSTVQMTFQPGSNKADSIQPIF
jgi:hypothetical protein